MAIALAASGHCPWQGWPLLELQILHMIGKGMSTRETAHSLNLSIKTVESHRQRIKRKLNLSTGTQLVQYAINWFSSRKLQGEGAPAAPTTTPE